MDSPPKSHSLNRPHAHAGHTRLTDAGSLNCFVIEPKDCLERIP